MPENRKIPSINENNYSLVDRFEEIIAGQIAYAESLIKKRAWSQLGGFLHQADPHEVATILASLSKTDSVIAFRLLDESAATNVFMNLDPEQQEKLLHAFSDSEAEVILTAMDPDDRTKLLGELPSTFVTRMLKLLPIEERKIANTLLNYPEYSAGRIMTPEFVSLSPDLSASDALSIIKSQASQKETIYTCYVVDELGKLVGSVNLAELILAPEKKRLKDFMKESPICASTQTNREEIAQLINYYDLIALPITDKQHRLVGIVTHDDIFDIIHKEATEDFHRFAGINPSEVSYLSGSLFALVINRSFWVILLLLIAGFSQDILLRYGKILVHHWMDLSLFFTVLVGVGGNIGSQSSILVIRGIASGEITSKNTGSLFLRALFSGLIMGVLLALVLILRIFIFHTGYSVQWIVAAAMVVLVTLSNLLGAMLPIILKRIHIDPAIVSAPLISTMMDLGGLVIYLEIARHFFD